MSSVGLTTAAPGRTRPSSGAPRWPRTFLTSRRSTARRRPSARSRRCSRASITSRACRSTTLASPSPADRVLVALDVPSLDEAEALLGRLEGILTGCKIGSQLFTAVGPVAIEAARKRGFRVFLDLKFHDIPTTAAAAGPEATRPRGFMLRLHPRGGPAAGPGRPPTAPEAAPALRPPPPPPPPA